MPDDYHFLAFFHQVQQLREVRLGLVNANGHDLSLVYFVSLKSICVSATVRPSSLSFRTELIGVSPSIRPGPLAELV